MGTVCSRAGILRIAPTGAPWSVWLFWDEAWAFAGWYVNLEAPHRREGRDLFSSDHVLDVWIAADGGWRMKDEDELDAAVDQGLFTAAERERFQHDARAALRTFRTGRFPFDEPWPDWRPDPAWQRPVLPGHATWELDQVYE